MSRRRAASNAATNCAARRRTPPQPPPHPTPPHPPNTYPGTPALVKDETLSVRPSAQPPCEVNRCAQHRRVGRKSRCGCGAARPRAPWCRRFFPGYAAATAQTRARQAKRRHLVADPLVQQSPGSPVEPQVKDPAAGERRRASGACPTGKCVLNRSCAETPWIVRLHRWARSRRRPALPPLHFFRRTVGRQVFYLNCFCMPNLKCATCKRPPTYPNCLPRIDLHPHAALQQHRFQDQLFFAMT